MFKIIKNQATPFPTHNYCIRQEKSLEHGELSSSVPITRVVIETNLRRCLSHWITNSLNNISTGSETTTSSFCVYVIYLETVLVDVNVLASLLIMVIISYG